MTPEEARLSALVTQAHQGWAKTMADLREALGRIASLEDQLECEKNLVDTLQRKLQEK